jgi:5-methylcytosine-specific restriction enzyme A
MKNKSIGTCELCERQHVATTVHHLTPKKVGGSFMPTGELCIPCHKQIHSLYTNEELGGRLNTIEDLKRDEKIRKWIRKQPPSKLVKTKKSKDRRKRKH